MSYVITHRCLVLRSWYRGSFYMFPLLESCWRENKSTSRPVSAQIHTCSARFGYHLSLAWRLPPSILFLVLPSAQRLGSSGEHRAERWRSHRLFPRAGGRWRQLRQPQGQEPPGSGGRQRRAAAHQELLGETQVRGRPNGASLHRVVGVWRPRHQLCVLRSRLQRLQAITCGQGLSSASLRRVHTTPNTMTNLVLPTPPGPSECLICSELALLVLFCPCQHSVACEGGFPVASCCSSTISSHFLGVTLSLVIFCTSSCFESICACPFLNRVCPSNEEMHQMPSHNHQENQTRWEESSHSLFCLWLSFNTVQIELIVPSHMFYT